MNENTPPADWIEGLLAAEYPPARFREACRAAATTGRAIHRLRSAHQRLRPHPLPVRSYLEGLARAAEVPLEAPLAWAGLRLSDVPDPSFAAAWGRLAAALRLGWPESRLQLHLTVLAATGSPVDLVPVRPRGFGIQDDPVAEGEEAVAATVAGLDPTHRTHLLACEEAARQAFFDASA